MDFGETIKIQKSLAFTGSDNDNDVLFIRPRDVVLVVVVAYQHQLRCP